jgi:hypothetical protein
MTFIRTQMFDGGRIGPLKLTFSRWIGSFFLSTSATCVCLRHRAASSGWQLAFVCAAQMHWCAAAIFPKRKQILYYDSFGDPGFRCRDALFRCPRSCCCGPVFVQPSVFEQVVNPGICKMSIKTSWAVRWIPQAGICVLLLRGYLDRPTATTAGYLHH